MDIIVQKFGGTSVGSAERIRNVAQLVKAELKQNNQVVVVVSAMAGVTDGLVKQATSLVNGSGTLSGREYDVVLSSGEIASAGLLALALAELQIKAQSFQGWQIPIETDGKFSDAKITHVETKALTQCLKQGIVPIICGFQGVHQNSITTLGRGGSDTTAVAIAAALKAKVCDIYTDVDGIYSIDPNKFSQARKIELMSYDEIISLAYAGAKVLHPRAAEIGKRYGIDICIRSSFNASDPGTIIKNHEAKMEKATVTAITHKDGQALLSAAQNRNFTDILKGLNGSCCNIETSSDDHIVISAANDDVPEIKLSLGAKLISVEQNLSKITIVGFGIKHDNQIVEKVFQIIQKRDIKVVQSTMTDISISLYVADVGKELAQDLHNALVG